MTADPFDARLEDGKLYGRGALDMKAEEFQELLRGIQSRDDQFKADLDVSFFRPAFRPLFLVPPVMANMQPLSMWMWIRSSQPPGCWCKP